MRTTVVMGLLAVAAAATWLAGRPSEQPALPPAADGDAGPLGYYLRGARLLGTDEQGRVTYQILAERLDEQPEQERLRLQGVRVLYRPVDETAWDISAASASAPKDGSQLELAGRVELTSTPTDGTAPVRIATEALRFSPDTSSAESDQAVTVRFGDWRLDAIGLRTLLKGDALKLESQVHGTFIPQ